MNKVYEWIEFAMQLSAALLVAWAVFAIGFLLIAGTYVAIR